jgi:hypothetical protein
MYSGAIPPFGGYNPNTGGINLQPNHYEQVMVMRQQLMAQRQQFQQKMLEENYPVKYIIGHAILVGALSLTVIVLQIVMIIYKSPNYNIGSGIWVGSYLLIAISLALLIS